MNSKRSVPEYRQHTGPPRPEPEPSVCRDTPACEGCPFPSHGFICRSPDGQCLKTRYQSLQ